MLLCISFLSDASLFPSVESDCLEEIIVGHDEAGKMHMWPVLLDTMGSVKGAYPIQVAYGLLSRLLCPLHGN